MRPTKVLRRLREAAEKSTDGTTPVMVVLETGKVIQGLITSADYQTEPLGPPGDQYPGPTSIVLRVEVTG